MGAEQIRVHSDSQLVVNQVLQQYEAREDYMIAYLAQVREVIRQFKGFDITQVPRQENVQADRLARLASSSETELQGIKVEYLSEPSVSIPSGMEVDPIDMAPSWIDPLLAFLTSGDLPIEKAEARRVRYRAARYHIFNGVLYKRGYTIPYLRCVHPAQVQPIM